MMVSSSFSLSVLELTLSRQQLGADPCAGETNQW